MRSYASIVFFTWFPTGLLLSFAYKSTLLASLVAVEHETPVSTFQDVLDNQLTFTLGRGFLMSALMRDSKREVVRYTSIRIKG